jgi:hypothetical protein
VLGAGACERERASQGGATKDAEEEQGVGSDFAQRATTPRVVLGRTARCRIERSVTRIAA